MSDPRGRSECVERRANSSDGHGPLDTRRVVDIRLAQQGGDVLSRWVDDDSLRDTDFADRGSTPAARTRAGLAYGVRFEPELSPMIVIDIGAALHICEDHSSPKAEDSFQGCGGLRGGIAGSIFEKNFTRPTLAPTSLQGR